MRNIIIAAFWLGLAVLLLHTCVASAQTNHTQFHPTYQNWTNQKGALCCNNEDCGQLDPADERIVGDHVEVRIEGTWCPVLDKHYLKTGNAPDWSTSHVCVARTYSSSNVAPVCERLLCYQPKPGT